MGAAASISDIAELGTEFEALKEKLQPEEVEALQKAFDEAELKGKGEGTTKGFVFGTSDPFSLVIPHSLYLKLTFPLTSLYSFIFLLSPPTNLLHHPSHRPSVRPSRRFLHHWCLPQEAGLPYRRRSTPLDRERRHGLGLCRPGAENRRSERAVGRGYWGY